MVGEGNVGETTLYKTEVMISVRPDGMIDWGPNGVREFAAAVAGTMLREHGQSEVYTVVCEDSLVGALGRYEEDLKKVWTR
jgi:hypothetical protein